MFFSLHNTCANCSKSQTFNFNFNYPSIHFLCFQKNYFFVWAPRCFSTEEKKPLKILGTYLQ